MALINPQSLYSGAAQVFDNRAHIAFQARVLQHHAAQQQALDDYYRKMPLLINEKGTRDFDRDSLNKSAQKFQNYWLQNKKEIRNGGQAAFEYEKMIRNHRDLVNSSLANGLTDVQIGKLRNNPTTKHLFNTPDVVEKIRLSHLPVDDQKHEDFDLETFTQGEKPLVLPEYMKRYDKIKLDDNKVSKNNPDGTITVTNTPQFGEGARNSIMSGATWDYVSSPSVKQAIDQLGAADETNPLNPVFKKHFGRDIQNPIDLTAAFIIANKIPEPTTQVVKSDQLEMLNKRQQFAKEQQSRSFAHAVQMQRVGFNHTDAKTETQQKENNEWIDSFIDNGVEKSKNYPLVDGARTVPLDIISSKALAKGQIQPSALSVSEDGNTFTPIYPTYDVNGNPLSIPNPSLTQPMDRQGLKLALGYKTLSKKDLGNTMKIPAKKVIKKDPLGLFK